VKLILVAGHPSAFEGSPSRDPHWQSYLIEREIDRRYNPATWSHHIVTMDASVKEVWPSEDAGKGYGEYSSSVFSGPYIERNRGKFDMVFLADVGGGWGNGLGEWKSQGAEFPFLVARMSSMMEGALQLVKDGGWLYCGKVGAAHVAAGVGLGGNLETLTVLTPVYKDRLPSYREDSEAKYNKAQQAAKEDYVIIQKQ
jgi:hypothetical protein